MVPHRIPNGELICVVPGAVGGRIAPDSISFPDALTCDDDTSPPHLLGGITGAGAHAAIPTAVAATAISTTVRRA
ncbi:hypothetical protein [Nocardia pseudovaccinii]|uniref:hypothetical protein n=1 Tax=Nocardia pseudovaccinii TaxID=189540 RepID=UPI001FE05EDE|nr:hypothetical protein [Nocardia pseudovaccinii]